MKTKTPKSVWRIFFEPRDIWIGVYWEKYLHYDLAYGRRWRIYICIIPCFPIMIQWWRIESV